MSVAVAIVLSMFYLGVGGWAALRVHRAFPVVLVDSPGGFRVLILNASLRFFLLIMVFLIATAPVLLIAFVAEALLN